MNRPYKYKLIQDGMVVAAVESHDKEQAIREIKHYAMLYSQDGPVEIKPKLLEDRKKRIVGTFHGSIKMTEIDQLKKELEEAHKEGQEQARLLGMSGSREAKLLTELERAYNTIKLLTPFKEANRIIEEYKYRDKAGEIMCNEALDKNEKEIESLEAELASKSAELEKENKNYVTIITDAMQKNTDRWDLILELQRKVERARNSFRKCAALAGHPNPAEGCRHIIAEANEVLAALGEKPATLGPSS